MSRQHRAPIGPLEEEPTHDFVWKWRILFAGKWQRTRMYQTEAEIRREHLEAKRLDETETLRPMYRVPGNE